MRLLAGRRVLALAQQQRRRRLERGAATTASVVTAQADAGAGEALLGQDPLEVLVDLVDGADRLAVARLLPQDPVADRVEGARHAGAHLARTQQPAVLGRRAGQPGPVVPPGQRAVRQA